MRIDVTVRMRVRVIGASLMLAYVASFAFSQSVKIKIAPVRVCVVQEKYSPEYENYAQTSGMDAQAIAKELSTLTLKNGTPVTGIAITRVSKDGADSLVNRARCLYAVEVHRYNPPNNNSPAIPGDIDVTLPENPSPPWTPHDQALILYRVRLVGSRKVLHSGAGRPPASHGHGSAIINFYPEIAAQIVKTLNRGKLDQLNP